MRKMIYLLLFVTLVSCSTAEKKSANDYGKGVSIYAFDVTGVSNKEESEKLNSIIGSMKGVSSCTVNSKSKIVAVIFDQEQISAENIATEINQSTDFILTMHTFKKVSGGCPIHKASWWFSWLPWVD